MTVANGITLLRLAICPFFLLIYCYPALFFVSPAAFPYVLLTFFVVTEGTDALDGFVARKFGQVTDLGKLLDPMADSITRISAFLAFTQPPVSLPVLYVFVLLYRDFGVGLLRSLLALRGVALAARTSGKQKAVIQALAIFSILALLLLQERDIISVTMMQIIAFWVAGGAVLYTFYSGFEYLYAFLQIKK